MYKVFYCLITIFAGYSIPPSTSQLRNVLVKWRDYREHFQKFLVRWSTLYVPQLVDKDVHIVVLSFVVKDVLLECNHVETIYINSDYQSFYENNLWDKISVSWKTSKKVIWECFRLKEITKCNGWSPIIFQIKKRNKNY